MSGTASATRSCAGARAPSTISAWCRRAPASATRSISNICRRPCGPRSRTASTVAFPDTLVGTDSHTTMVNGLAVLGWGVGGIEAEAAMLGQPISMLIPEVIGFRLTGKLREGVTATDLVLTVTERLRRAGVVGKFVEFFGAGPRQSAARGSRHHRQHGAGIWRDLRLLPHRRGDARLSRGHRPQGAAHRAGRGLCARRKACSATTTRPTRCSPTRIALDLAEVEPSIAGPKRPQDRVPLDPRRRRLRRGARQGIWQGAARRASACRCRARISISAMATW